MKSRLTSSTRVTQRSGRSWRHKRLACFDSLTLEVLEDRRLLTVSYILESTLAGATVYRTVSEALPMLTDVAPLAANANGPFDIQLQKSPTLLANPIASAAWDAAAEIVEGLFFDPITVIIDADVSVLGAGILAQAGSVSVDVAYDQLRNLLVADAQQNEILPALLPTFAQLQTVMPVDPNPLNPAFSLVGAQANRATMKALGIPESQLPSAPSQHNPAVNRDVSIAFNSDFNFDFDPSDGITAGTFDFVGIAIHEILHGLGFVSVVDTVDFLGSNPQFSRDIRIDALDLYRLRPGGGAVDFTTAPRVLTPEGDAVVFDGVFDPSGFTTIPGLTIGDAPMSTGITFGDGQQASHWKADEVSGVYIGIMDPTIAPGVLGVVTSADLRALGHIGWDLIQTVPPVELSVTGISALEGDEGTTDFVFTVFASNSTIEDYTVAFTTLDDTALAGSDYQAISGTLTFTPDGPLTQTVTVKVLGDVTVEPNETFLFRLSDATGPASIGTAEAVGQILNDDVEVSIGDATLFEGHDGTRNAVFAITAFGSVNRNIAVTYTTLNGSASGAVDYLPRTGTVLLTPLVPTGSVTVPIVGDRLNEGTETFQVVITRSEGSRIGKGVGVGTILDDDPLPSFYVNDVQVTTTAAGTFAAVFTVGLDAVSGRAVTVNFATADFGAISGIDYAGLTGVLTFQPGVRTQTVAVSIMTGAVHSADKKFHLNLSSAQNAAMADPQGVATIVFANAPVGERIIDNGEAGYTRSNGWTTLTNTLAYGLDYDYHAAGNGTGTANYTFTALTPGNYEVYARWIPFSNRATNAPFTILNGATPVGTVIVNQQAAPAGDVSNGVTWQKLGTFNTTTGTLVVRLGDNANGLVVADAVRLVADGIADQVPEINVAGLGLSINDADNTPSDADGTEFGNVNLNTDSSPHTFTIVNNGNALLQLGGSPRVLISGANAADFLVTVQPAAGVNPNGSTNFAILFRPTGTGLRQAVVTIANNDSDEGPYTFAIQGTGVAVASPFAHNEQFPQDVNADERVSASDALILVNRLLLGQSATPLAATDTGSTVTYYPDVNADGRISTSDLLMVINYLLSTSAAPQAAPAAAPLAAPAVDEAFVLFDDTADATSDEPAARVEAGGGGDHGDTADSHASARALTSAAVGAALSIDEDDEAAASDEELEWDLLTLDV